MILAGNEGTPVEGKRHMPIVGPRAEVRRSSPTANILHLVTAQHEHDKPVSVVGVAMGQLASPRCRGQRPVCQLKPRINAGHLWRRRQAFLRRLGGWLVQLKLWQRRRTLRRDGIRQQRSQFFFRRLLAHV